MHDQNISCFCELNEFWISAVLIGAKDDRYASRLHAVRQGRHISMRYSQRGHCRMLSLQHDCRVRFRNVNHADMETNASGDNCSDIRPNTSTAMQPTKRGTERWKCASFLIEKPSDER